MTPRPGMRWTPRMVGVIPGVGRCTVLSVDDRGIPDSWWPEDGDKRDGPGRATLAHGRPGWCADVWSDAVPDWSDGPTLGAVEHDVLGPAGWWVERDTWPSQWRYQARSTGRAGAYRASLAEALRDALEVIDG